MLGVMLMSLNDSTDSTCSKCWSCVQWWARSECGRQEELWGQGRGLTDKRRAGRSREKTEQLKRRRTGWWVGNFPCSEDHSASGAANITAENCASVCVEEPCLPSVQLLPETWMVFQPSFYCFTCLLWWVHTCLSGCLLQDKLLWFNLL